MYFICLKHRIVALPRIFPPEHSIMEVCQYTMLWGKEDDQKQVWGLLWLHFGTLYHNGSRHYLFSQQNLRLAG